jgi:RNA polymerase sigma-70 factor (ECF subfamily)
MSEIPNDKLKQLLLATAQSDAKAFKTLYDATSPRLLAAAQTIMRDPGLAEDVLQDAFVQVWHRAGEFHADRGSVLTWMTTIVRYRAIDLLRKRGHDGSSGKSPPIDVDPADIDFLQRSDAGEAEQPQASPLAHAISGEENSRLRECIDRLSINQQRSVTLAFFRGFTHQELAVCLAEPLGTVKSRLRRSLARLKDCLETLVETNEIRRGAS